MSIFSLFCRKSAKPTYPQDTIVTRSGEEVTLTFFKHASLALEVGGKHIYIDPVDSFADYARLPKADVVVVTHSHYDHLDRTAIDKITTRETVIVCDKTSAEAFDFDCVTMTPGLSAEPIEGVKIEAVAAYNTSEGHLDFHPKEREDCGYIITPAKDHKHKFTKVAKKEATCTEPGNTEYYTCDGCSDFFADSEGKTKITDTVIAPLGHTISEDWKFDETNHWRTCTVCNTVLIETQMGHQLSGEKCTSCGYGIEADVTAPTEEPTVETPQKKNDWLPILLVALVSFAAAITVTVIILKKKKK